PPLAESRVDVATQERHLDVAAACEDLCAAPDAGRPDPRARREAPQPVRPTADEDVTGIRSGRDGADRGPGRARRRHILHRVYGAVDTGLGQRLLELLHEESFAADRGQRAL